MSVTHSEHEHEGSGKDAHRDDLALAPVQRRLSNGATAALASVARAVQAKGSGGGAAGADPHAIAESGFAGGGGAYPHEAAIERAFGMPVQAKAHAGGAAADACNSLGAEAYASGNSVAFRDSSPSLHTAAHEAAHVIQQRSGSVQLKGGFGEVGDSYEAHADAVADAVVQGKSAAPLLARFGGGAGHGVQMKTDTSQGAEEHMDSEKIQLKKASEGAVSDVTTERPAQFKLSNAGMASRAAEARAVQLKPDVQLSAQHMAATVMIPEWDAMSNDMRANMPKPEFVKKYKSAVSGMNPANTLAFRYACTSHGWDEYFAAVTTADMSKVGGGGGFDAAGMPTK